MDTKKIVTIVAVFLGYVLLAGWFFISLFNAMGAHVPSNLARWIFGFVCLIVLGVKLHSVCRNLRINAKHSR